MVTTWAIPDISNLKELWGTVPFDVLACVLFKYSVADIRAKAVSLDLVDNRTYTAGITDIKTLKADYDKNYDLLGLAVKYYAYDLRYILETLKKNGVTLSKKDEDYLNNETAMPTVLLGSLFELCNLGTSKAEACATALKNANFSIMIKSVMNSVGLDVFTVLAVFFNELTKTDNELAWLENGYYVTVKQKSAKKKTQTNTEPKEKVSKPAVTETREETTVHNNETKEESKTETVTVKYNSNKAVDIFACSKKWSFDELVIVVSYMSFMRVADLAKLVNWGTDEIEYKINELKSLGLNTVEELKNYMNGEV